MANTFYIKIDGATQGTIEGDCTQAGRENLIVGYKFVERTTIPRHSDTGQPTGSRVHHPICFTKHVDKASPKLWQAMTTGERLGTVRFDFYKINEEGTNENFYSIELEQAIIVEMQSELKDTAATTDTVADEMLEHVYLTYRKIRWIHILDTVEAEDDWNQR